MRLHAHLFKSYIYASAASGTYWTTVESEYEFKHNWREFWEYPAVGKYWLQSLTSNGQIRAADDDKVSEFINLGLNLTQINNLDTYYLIQT